MNSWKRKLAGEAQYSSEKMIKVDLFSSNDLLLGLNCLEEGQSQNAHTHDGADKFYYVVQGRARLTVGEEQLEAETGDVVLCPAGVPHGIDRALQRTLILVGIAPSQKK